MVTIEKITKKGKQCYEVLLSSEYKLNMYASELRKYALSEGDEISDELFAEIKHTCVTVRARKKVLALLEQCDQPEAELRRKLRLKGFDAEATDDAIAYAYSFKYIDDKRFARNYLYSYIGTKSKTSLRFELEKKGIDKDTFEELYLEVAGGDDPEADALNKAIRKKCKDISTLSDDEKRKIAMSLYRKGFSLSSINKALNTECE